MTDRKKWVGDPPPECNICHSPIEDYFVDGKTILGPWAIMCELCHTSAGLGLGTGKGQSYRKRGNDWIKIAG
jgi:hypothetical protein